MLKDVVLKADAEAALLEDVAAKAIMEADLWEDVFKAPIEDDLWEDVVVDKDVVSKLLPKERLLQAEWLEAS